MLHDEFAHKEKWQSFKSEDLIAPSYKTEIF